MPLRRACEAACCVLAEVAERFRSAQLRKTRKRESCWHWQRRRRRQSCRPRWRRCVRRRSLHHATLSGESCGKTICKHAAASPSVLSKQMVHHGAPAARRPAWLPRMAMPGARPRQCGTCRASCERRREADSTFAALPRSAFRRLAVMRSPFCPRRRSASDNSGKLVDYSREFTNPNNGDIYFIFEVGQEAALAAPSENCYGSP
jgi:hypothetical protein